MMAKLVPTRKTTFFKPKSAMKPRVAQKRTESKKLKRGNFHIVPKKNEKQPAIAENLN